MGTAISCTKYSHMADLWTLDSGLDHGVDHGLDYMDSILDFILDWKAESTNFMFPGLPMHRSLFDHLESCARSHDYADSYGFIQHICQHWEI